MRFKNVVIIEKDDVLMGLFDKKTNNKKPVLRCNVSPSCFDCKHCDSSQTSNGLIYCKWDSEFYPPETGHHSCPDFSKQ